MSNLFSLENQVAIVTGGNRGLGGAMSLGLAEAGADIVIVQRSEGESEIAKKIKELGRKCLTISYDLSNIRDLHTIVDRTLAEFGRLDILVNNAGVQRRHPCVEFPEEDWDYVLDVNAKAVFFLAQAAGKVMIKQGRGKIINTASLLSYQGGITVPAYAASKGAVAQITKALSNEWAKFGVNVNAIAPGYMATDMNTALIEDEVRNRQILERIPAGRWGRPEDIKGAVVFLASELLITSTVKLSLLTVVG